MMTVESKWHRWPVEAVLLFAVGYNLVLAVINANVVGVSPAWAYAAEGLAYVGCVALGIRALQRRQMALLLGAVALLVAIALLRFAATGAIDPKSLRDAIIPFAFVMLGASYRGSIPSLFLRLALLVTLVSAFEIVAPAAYGDLVDPRSYFVNTRGAAAEDFWNQDSKLYVSANRPGERNFLAGFDLPRASSIFVEPVTMGNFIIFFMAIALTFGSAYGPLKKLLAFAIVAFLIVASDGRLASVTCLLMLLATPLFRRTGQVFAAAIFAIVVLGGWLLVAATGTTVYDDTTLGRIFVTVKAMTDMPLPTWFGLDIAAPASYSDSGIAYFIASQSIVGVLAFVLGYALLLRMRTSNGQLFKNLFIFALALGLLVSNSYFSIKTAALWWFTIGHLWRLPGLAERIEHYRGRASQPVAAPA